MNSGFRILTASSALLLASTAAGSAADLQSQPLPAKAAPMVQSGVFNPILYVNNQISLDAIGQHIDYLETSNGGPLDGEKGWQPGLQLTGSAMFDLGPLSNVYLMGQFSWAKANTTYTGAYIRGGGYGSVVATTKVETKDFDFRFGKGFDASQNWMFTPFVGIGYHVWDRNGGYAEKYEHGYAGGGLMIQWAPTQQWVISANGLVGSTFSPQVSSPGDAAIPAGTLNLGSKLMWKAGLSADYALTPQWHVNAGFDYTHFNYGISSNSLYSAYYGALIEPDSRSDIWTAKIGFGYSFYQPTARY